MSATTLSSRPAQAAVKTDLVRRPIVKQQSASRPATTAKRPTFFDLLMRALGAVTF